MGVSGSMHIGRPVMKLLSCSLKSPGIAEAPIDPHLMSVTQCVDEFLLADVSTAGHVVNVAGFGMAWPLPPEWPESPAATVGQTVPDDAQEVLAGVDVFVGIEERLMVE